MKDTTDSDTRGEKRALKRIFKRIPDNERMALWLELQDNIHADARQMGDSDIELLSEYTDEAIERNKNWGKMQGLSTGYKNLDDLTLGLVGSELIVIAGKTSYGKTTLAINIANHVALSGTPVLFVTLEMSKGEIASRFMHINGGENDNYYTVASLVAVNKKDRLNYQTIRPMIKKFHDDFGVGLVVIDHLHYFSREIDNVAEDLGRITEEFKATAKEYKLPVILISHVRKTGKAEATMEDLRGSSYIAQDSDIVLMVGKSTNDDNKMAVQITKNRNRGFHSDNSVAILHADGIKISEQPFSD